LQALDLALMKERYAQLDRVHGGWRRRLKLVLAARWGLHGAGAGLAGGLAVSLAALYARALVPEAYVRLLALGAVLGAGLAAALALAWPRSSLSTAIDLDQRLGLRERLSTAVELRRRGWPGALARSQLEDTLQTCARATAEGAFAGPKQIERMLRVSPLTIGAVYKKGERVGQGYVLNLSRGGMFLSTKEDFPMGEEFRLRFFLPFQLGQVDALVVVRWRTQDVDNPPPQLRTGLGCEFARIDPEMVDKIDEFIDRFVELADKLEEAARGAVFVHVEQYERYLVGCQTPNGELPFPG